MKIKVKLLPPNMPNFIRIKIEAGLRQDVTNENNAIDIATLTEDEALEFAELMKQTFLEHYRDRKLGSIEKI